MGPGESRVLDPAPGIDRPPAKRSRLWLLSVGAVAAILGALVALGVVAGGSLPERNGPPVEQLAVERTVLQPGVIELTLRNTGPDPVQIAQAAVNDVFVDFDGGEAPLGRLGSTTVRLSYPWQDGQPYAVSLLTSTGLVVEHQIPAAVLTPTSDSGVLGLMALLGLYVGILPVALGMMVLPLLRRAGPGAISVLMAVTVGLLAFLALDAGLEALALGGGSGGAFGGPALAVLGAALAFLALSAVGRVLRRRGTGGPGGRAAGLPLAFAIALGIGLHNLGEGLAIGSAYAVGELALGASLVVGFALHNTTEGIAIVAPLTRQRTAYGRLVALGLVAGAPAVLGAMLGVQVDNAELSALLLGVGVGAIVQVLVQIAPTLRGRGEPALSPTALGGIAAGILIMYVTGLLVVL